MPSTFRWTLVPPGVPLYTRETFVAIMDIRGLVGHVGEPRVITDRDPDVLRPIRPPLLLRNADGTFEVVSDVATLRQDISGTCASKIVAVEIRNGPEHRGDIELVRIHSSIVDANRITMSNSEVIRASHDGILDPVARKFVAGRGWLLRGHKAIVLMLGNKRISKSNHNYWVRKFTRQSSESNASRRASVQEPRTPSKSPAPRKETPESKKRRDVKHRGTMYRGKVDGGSQGDLFSDDHGQ